MAGDGRFDPPRKIHSSTRTYGRYPKCRFFTYFSSLTFERKARVLRWLMSSGKPKKKMWSNLQQIFPCLVRRSRTADRPPARQPGADSRGHEQRRDHVQDQNGQLPARVLEVPPHRAGQRRRRGETGQAGSGHIPGVRQAVRRQPGAGKSKRSRPFVRRRSSALKHGVTFSIVHFSVWCSRTPRTELRARGTLACRPSWFRTT